MTVRRVFTNYNEGHNLREQGTNAADTALR
ncbi:Uncharacterised protein [Mycobacteroides abscessus subsp. abscessus]|nr:Uncharacterised protein [Mycobacteroides abscessus subsp. abscessus]SKV79528.1 Uncharacterised protein [Mycobacteroides abscessus subsp. abscessus]